MRRLYVILIVTVQSKAQLSRILILCAIISLKDLSLSLSLSLSLFPICFTNPCLSVKYKVEQVIIIFFHLTSKAYRHEPMTSLSYHFCYLE